MRRVVPIVLVLAAGLALAGCGGMDQAATTTTTAAKPPGPGKTLYAGGPWAVVVDGGKATAFHQVEGTWTPDTSGAVKIRVLGPHPDSTAARRPQVAAEISAKKPLVESGLWVDGEELPVKGGGITPTRGTIYGTTGAPLAKGKHLAVAYGRTDRHATAVAWSFRVS